MCPAACRAKVLCGLRDKCTVGRLGAPQREERRRDPRQLVGVVDPGARVRHVLLEVPEHGRDAASPTLEEIPVKRGKFHVRDDVGGEGPGRVGEASVRRSRACAFDGCAECGEVVRFRHCRDVALEERHGRHGTALRGRAERRLDARPAHHAHRLTDGFDERHDVLDQVVDCVVRVVAGETSTARAGRVAGEPVGEAVRQRLVGNLPIPPSPVDQDQRRALSANPADNLGAIGRKWRPERAQS